MSDDPLDILLDNAEARIRAVQVTEILTDLIAGMRELHWTYSDGDGWCQECGSYSPCPSLRIADGAQARLREVQGE